MGYNGPPPAPTSSPNTEIGGGRRREPGSWRLVLAEIIQIIARFWQRLSCKEIGPGSDKAQAIESLATIFETTTEQAGRYLESKGGDWREAYAEMLFDEERERGFRLWLNASIRIAKNTAPAQGGDVEIQTRHQVGEIDRQTAKDVLVLQLGVDVNEASQLLPRRKPTPPKNQTYRR